MPIIILEGCDCAGKSSLAQALHKHTGFEIVQGSSFEISQLGTEAMYDYMMKLLDKNNIIIDRFYLSNYVYGNLYGYPTMSERQFMELSVRADERALSVYVTASLEELTLRMKSRGDDSIKYDEIENILNKYEQGMREPLMNPCLYLRIDTTSTKAEQFASTIFEFADMTERKILQGRFNEK